ncbi:hypothetical protein RP20_CCG006304 [Aedes albopictus]|nr:hypothetical protein RP20_CCG006304 [Aedes albopictus]
MLVDVLEVAQDGFGQTRVHDVTVCITSRRCRPLGFTHKVVSFPSIGLAAQSDREQLSGNGSLQHGNTAQG